MRALALALMLATGCGAAPAVVTDGGTTDLTAAISDLATPAADLYGRDVAGSDFAFTEGTLLPAATLTYYWVTAESDYSGAADTPLCDSQANILAMVPAAFASALRIEGTGRLGDGRLLNVSDSGPCPAGGATTTRYSVVDEMKYPWGIGVKGWALQPYRSVAVDPAVIPYGTPLYVPDFDGILAPGSYGFVHDGCVIAEDTGGGIDGAHIDFFVAEKKNYLTLASTIGLDMVDLYIAPSRCSYLGH